MLSYFRYCENMKIKCCPHPTGARANHVEAFKALAHIDRLRTFFALVRARKELPAGAVQRAVGLPAPSVSRHLDQLRRAGLVASRRRERNILYRVRPEMVSDLVRLLTACC